MFENAVRHQKIRVFRPTIRALGELDFLNAERLAMRRGRIVAVWRAAVQQSNYNYVMTLDGVIAARGGMPLIENSRIIGAIGCSGGTGSQDEVACKAGAATIK